ncbi:MULTISPECIES: hypothetical protein [unclassified Pseudomonas]|uniref:DUF6896 domain-containing protein n=1 Tax=unclassified Pseudomonas TaxID=196821 RepID=UPI0011132E80|nr:MULTISPECIES: hypothetical protein [unclassified Pseudomonas]
MNGPDEELLAMVVEYLSRVESAVALFEERFGVRCILKLWGSGHIDRCGVVFEGVTYELHGIGCAVHFSDACIDFDYGPEGRTDVFDVWRLYMYACEFPVKYAKYASKEDLELEFYEYLALGVFEMVSGPLNAQYSLR